MNHLTDISPLVWATIILVAATLFVVTWSLDAVTHKKLAHIDITDKELQTHRTILVASFLMEFSLVAMFWFPLEALPFFIAFVVTRTVHEFIDELKYHSDRCTPYESRLHLVMWFSIIVKTSTLFIWGFFLSYEGVLNLPVIFYVWTFVLLTAMAYVSWVEWRR